MSAALTHAADTEYLGRNVARKVKPPTPIKKEVEPLTREEVGKLLHAAFNTEFYYPILIAVFTGLRRSELLALTWADANLEER